MLSTYSICSVGSIESINIFMIWNVYQKLSARQARLQTTNIRDEKKHNRITTKNSTSKNIIWSDFSFDFDGLVAKRKYAVCINERAAKKNNKRRTYWNWFFSFVLPSILFFATWTKSSFLLRYVCTAVSSSLPLPLSLFLYFSLWLRLRCHVALSCARCGC